MNVEVEMPPELNFALAAHGDSAGPSNCPRLFRNTSSGAGTWDEPLDASDDSEGHDDSNGRTDLGLREELGSLLNYLWAWRIFDGKRSSIIVEAFT